MKIERKEIPFEPEFKPYAVQIVVENAHDERALKLLRRHLVQIDQKGYYSAWFTELAAEFCKLFPLEIR